MKYNQIVSEWLSDRNINGEDILYYKRGGAKYEYTYNTRTSAWQRRTNSGGWLRIKLSEVPGSLIVYCFRTT